jgi:broad specificity phosphatase PhoE
VLFRPKDKFKPKEIITIPPTIPDESNWEENESQSSQAAPPSPQVAPPSPQVAPPSPQVAPPAPRPPPQFDLILVRHGISCGNLAKKKGQTLFQHAYTDPELTTWGREKAKVLGPYLKEELKRDVVVGSSNLLRAQQTAFLMLKPEEVLIVPYISEKGMGEDNRAFSKQGQKTILEQYTCGDMEGARMNWTYFDEAPKASTPSSAKFLEWLKREYRTLVKGVVGTPLVFFSHGRFIRDFILEQVAVNPDFKESLFPKVPFHLINGKVFDKLLHDAMKNYTATRFRIVIDGSEFQITDIQFLTYEQHVPDEHRDEYEYRKDLDATKECEVDGCRKRICEGTLFRTRRSQQNVCNAYVALSPRKIQTASRAAANELRAAANVPPIRINAANVLLTTRLLQGNAPPPSTISIGNGSTNNRTNNRTRTNNHTNTRTNNRANNRNRNNNIIEEIEVVDEEYNS